MRNLILIILFIHFNIAAYNQLIKGTILDEKTKNTISFASVYLNGTFVGTTTDQNGNFELNISQHTSLPLTISAIGYYSATLAGFPFDKPIIIYLTPKVYELSEVVINAKSYSRKRKANLKFFKNEFLGRTANARDCEITNLKDITFNYNSDQDTLKAFASKPILIDNKALGYKIIYYLDRFEYYKRSNSLFYKGSIFFKEDLETDELQKQIYERKRKEAYLGSRMHFFRSLWNNDLHEAGFKVQNLYNENLKIDKIVFQEDSLTKFLKYPEVLGICYHEGLPSSYIIFKRNQVNFAKNGYFDPSALSWQGIMATQRMADCLPYEYSMDAPVNMPYFSAYDSSKFVEKLYLHFDRNHYSPGDDIWFKAYLANASTNKLISSDSLLHVELYTREAKLIANEIIRLKNGTGNGDFRLDEDLPVGIYFVRAYTNWMRNFGELCFFTRAIEIRNTFLSEKRTKTVDTSENHKIDLQFMPEGGNLIQDVLSEVGFKAIDQKGHGCDIKGNVYSSANDSITSFKSSHLGMGKVSFIPKPGLTYYAAGKTADGSQFKVLLPLVKEMGYILHVTDVNENYFKVVTRTNLAGLKNKTYRTMYLSCLSRNILCMAGKIPADTTINTIFIDKKNFPEGIACIRLFDSALQPQCERLFYVHKKDSVNLNVSADRMEYPTQEKSAFTIEVTDFDHNPVTAELSMAVTDVDSSSNDKFNSDICSSFLLESEIRGNIEQPGYYFDPEQADRFRSLDLLLLTQGWSNFIWKQLPDYYSSLYYPKETGIPVSGRLRQTIRNKAIPAAVISLALFDSIHVPLFQTATTDLEGKFVFSGLSFNGTRRLIVGAVDSKKRKRGLLQLDSLNMIAPIHEASFNNDLFTPVSLLQKGSGKDLISKQVEMRPIRRKKFSIRDTLAIDQVEVHARKSLMPDDGRYRMYGLPAYVIEGKDVKGYAGIDEFLEIASIGGGFKVGGFCPKGLGIAIHNCQTSIMGSSNRVIILLDGMEIPADYLCSLDPTEIQKIEVLTRSGSVIFGSGVCGVLSIFSKRGGETKNEPPTYVVQKEIQGYYQSREFYCPEFNRKDIPDLRTATVFWDPNIATDSSGKAQISFYNKNKKGWIHAQVEGLTGDGVPLSGSINYQVK
jgi:CarboxypepD_reg-like domain